MSRSVLFVAIALIACATPILPASARANDTAGDASFTLMPATLDVGRATALDKLSAARRGGSPLAVQEIEILDAFEAGLPIADVEADVVISRALYDVHVAGQAPSAEQRDLLERYRAHWSAHARDVLARNRRMNADAPRALGTREPDGSLEWEMYSDPALFEQASSAYQRRLQAWFGWRGRVTPRAADDARTAWPSLIESARPDVIQAAPPNTLVNNPAADAGPQDTQSGSVIVLGSGNTILAAFDDSGSLVGGAFHLTGIARSIDGGTSWTDQGTLPNDPNGDVGWPTFARNNVSGTIILATLGYASAATLPTFRTTNDGASYLSQVDGDGGGTSNDKEWLTCDNFAGAGQGNFYLFYRDFGVGGGMSLTRSTDNGATWIPRQVLASVSGQLGWVVVGADHAVYCFWLGTGNQIVFRKSTNLGVSFGAQATITTLRTTAVNGNLGLNGGFRTNAALKVVAHPTDANQLYLIWNDKGIAPSLDKANIYFSKTTDGGTSWSAPVQVNTDTGTDDNWHPVIAITGDGTGLFTSWYDRRLHPSDLMIDVYARHATISGTTVTFGTEYRITDTSYPPVVGQDPSIQATYMGDYDMAVADNTSFYRTWGDNRLPHLSHAHQPDVRFTKVPKAGPGAVVAGAGSAITSEGCLPPNNAIDPNEAVTVGLAVSNLGSANTTSLVGTLQAGGGVTMPSGPQSYGVVTAGGPAVTRSFSFRASGACGDTITATLQLQDGPANLGTATYRLVLGEVPIAYTTYSSGGVAVPIPDIGNMVDQQITVAGFSGGLHDLNVKIRLSHTYDSDLAISLVAPNSTVIPLSTRRGGEGDNFGSGAADCSGVFAVFDDAAPTAISAGVAPFAGSFRPETPLSAVHGISPNGIWTLRINDTAAGDSGTLFCWQLEIGRVIPICNTGCGAVAVEDPPGGRFAVWQNEPNPFATRTSIRYSLPVAAPVRLDVFNVQGRKVATLVQETKGPGAHTVSFGAGEVDAAGNRIETLPAGVYFYRLQAGNFMTTRKMLVVR